MKFAAAALTLLAAVGRTGAQDSLAPSISSQPSGMPSDVPSDLPSNQPSDLPSNVPSDVPSDLPSNVPSDLPSNVPSDVPSDLPSNVPSDVPSDLPSNVPSDVPSSLPSNVPSDVPSKVPSDVPSSLPSNVPSDVPSKVPSDVPSSLPSQSPSESAQPSDQPSDHPSETPSDVPSSEPSSEPSSTPSCSPSASPTESPSTEYGVNLFYPDWAAGDSGCRNDGDEPDYMAVNPTQWLSSTMQACCKKYFAGYMYDACMGRYPPDHDDCNVMLYYPDWNGSNKGCLDDGKEPYYMLSNHQYFLSNSLEECCEKFYEWDFYECSGTTPVLTNGDFYPDWSGGGSTCLADGKMPDYMISNQKWYLSTTLEKCCERHFYWELNECLGTTAVGTDKWYVDYDDEKCVQDCSGGASSCGGVANFWEELFSTKEQCCKAKLGWVPKCRFK